MKLKEFKNLMCKPVFTSNEAGIVSFCNDQKLINLQLHMWEKNSDITRLKRGLYMFRDAKANVAVIAKHLHFPCYFSLEYILSMHGIIPEALFAYTLVTPKVTKRFSTPFGNFIYHKIKKQAFAGFDPITLMAEKEKAFVDYIYLNKSKMFPNNKYWEESRICGDNLNIKKLKKYAHLFKSKKLTNLINSFINYAKSN